MIKNMNMYSSSASSSHMLFVFQLISSPSKATYILMKLQEHGISRIKGLGEEVQVGVARGRGKREREIKKMKNIDI